MTDSITIQSAPERTVPSSSMLKLRVMESRDRAAALTLWRNLEERVDEVPLAASESWTRIWLDHYGETVRYRFLIAEDEGLVRGMALVTESSDRKGPGLVLRTRHLGTAGDPVSESACVEYNALLAEPAWRSSFIDTVAHWMLTQSGGDVVRLDGFTAEESQALTSHWPAVEVRERSSKYLNLDLVRDSQEEIIAHFGRSTRANLRKRLREYGDLHTEWGTTPESALDILTELIQLHQDRWNSIGQRGSFASPRFLAFQWALVRELITQQRCVPFRVRHQDQTIGCLLLLVDRGRLLDYLSGLAPFDQMPSPGLVTHYLCQCAALARGYSAYDFLVGDKRHKDNLSTHTQILTWTQLVRPTLKNRIVGALTCLKRRWHPLPTDATTSTTTARPIAEQD